MLFCPWIILKADLILLSVQKAINNIYAINYPELQTNSKIFRNARYFQLKGERTDSFLAIKALIHKYTPCHDINYAVNL